MTAPTIRDVAAAAGVSATTVSHALNGKGRVDAATRQRVQHVADELGYRPSRVARRLRSGRSGTLGLALPEIPDAGANGELIGLHFYMQLAAGATRAAFSRDHALLLLPPLRDAVDALRIEIDGAILNDPVESDPRIDAFDAADIPVVTIDRDLGRPDRRWWVASDTRTGTHAMLDHLAEAGARRIALLTMDAPWSWLSDSRAAYSDWCSARDISPRVVTTPLEFTGVAAEHHAGALLDAEDRPDAIFAPPEHFAVAVARAAARRGLCVGIDLKLASGVDSHEARTHDPPITALDLHPAAQGTEAVDLLTAILAGLEPPAPRLVQADLHARASSARF